MPVPPNLQAQIREVKHLLDNSLVLSFDEKANRSLFSDSSTNGWAGLDPMSERFVHDFWRKKPDLHMNFKELEAAIFMACSLACRKQTVLLKVEN